MSADFSTSHHTAIISDLHLCEAEPVNPKFKLWKKYKTREFFFDDIFAQFLEEIQKKAQASENGAKVELILNGDIFDFDSVTRLPEDPVFRVSWLEKKRGLFPQEERSLFKISVILDDHAEFMDALRNFILKGNRVIFVIGNHDLEVHYPAVQAEIRNRLNLDPQWQDSIRFVEWFYVSNHDTLIEHGNQYDPYCLCEDPIHPFSKGYNYIYMKLPFGNLACRFIMNGMGFFNPHVDSNYIMTMREYITTFLRYMIRAQPFLLLTWLTGSVMTLVLSFKDRLAAPIKNPLKLEDRIQEIAEKSNTEPRVVREMQELFVPPATSRPLLVFRELWLDRAFIVLIAFFLIYQVFSALKIWFGISLFWGFIPLFLFLPFFLFYSKSIQSLVSGYKEPEDRILALTSAITRVNRVVYGHTHKVRHELIGAVEHLNPGCWSPAFLDIECTKPIDQKHYVWICPDESGLRKAELIPMNKTHSI
ncbi:MAG: metallophosphoesterase [Bdellovibrionota bacterium]